MTLAVFILIVTCLTNFSLGLFILLRNPKLYSSISFFILSLSISAWAVSSYLTEADVPLSINSLFNKLAYLFGYWALVAILLFSYNFPQKFNASKAQLIGFIVSVGLISTLSVTPLVAGEVSRDAEGLHFTIGSLSTVYLLAVLATLVLSIRKLLRTRKRSNQKAKSQIRLILIGFVSSVLLGVIMSVVIPLLLQDFTTAKFGPLFTVVLVGTTTYAIIKYGLFDIKLVVARSAAYVLSVLGLAAIYTTVVFALTRYVLHGRVEGFDTSQQLVNVGTALFLAFSFQTLKKFFDKISNQIFYRDNYDAQLFLDELNKVLVSNIEIEPLLKGCIKVIEDNIKAEFCTFGIRESGYMPRRIIGDTQRTFSDSDIEAVRLMTPHIPHKVLVTDYIEDEYPDLYKILHRNNVAVLVRLVATLKYDVEGVGYIVLGPKKSGNNYTSQDMKMLEIIANELVIAVQNSMRFEEIEEFNLTLQGKVDDATKRLRQTNEKLKALDETKDEFISMASHQLRTPLTSVKGYLSMVLEGDAGEISAMQRKLLDQAFVSSQRMVYLIADLLNVSRLRTGKFVIEPIASNLADVVEGEIGQLKETATGRGLELTYDKPTDFPTLYLDETKIRQVIMNFTDNAIYYTPSGGHITVKLEDKGESIECTVTDDGMGVPKNEQPHLFTKFYRANNAKKARPDGTGLGLFMAKKVIVAQGGSIIFSSHEGKGSTFGFMFPKDKLQLPAPVELVKETA